MIFASIVWGLGFIVMELAVDAGYRKAKARILFSAAWPVWLAVVILAPVLDLLEARP